VLGIPELRAETVKLIGLYADKLCSFSANFVRPVYADILRIRERGNFF